MVWIPESADRRMFGKPQISTDLSMECYSSKLQQNCFKQTVGKEVCAQRKRHTRVEKCVCRVFLKGNRARGCIAQATAAVFGRLNAAGIQFAVNIVPPVGNSAPGGCNASNHHYKNQGQHDAVLHGGRALGVLKKLLH